MHETAGSIQISGRGTCRKKQGTDKHNKEMYLQHMQRTGFSSQTCGGSSGQFINTDGLGEPTDHNQGDKCDHETDSGDSDS